MSKFIYEGKDKIAISRNCRTCEFNFNKICAGGFRKGDERRGNGLYYGEVIKDIKVERNCWESVSIEYFISLRKRLEKKRNKNLIRKVEKDLGINFSIY